MWYRLMDAIEPEILDKAETILQQLAGVKALHRLRMRWISHRLQAEVCIAGDPQLTVVEGHHVAVEVRHALFHQISNLSEVVVHVNPGSTLEDTYHELTVHHEKAPPLISSPA